MKTETQPALRVIFLPRFWGSYERRWELGKNHLVASGDRRTLCGHGTHTDADQGEHGHIRPLEPGEPLPGQMCKKCRAAAKR
jgi:hypothetical protein